MDVLPTYVLVHREWRACGGQKKGSGPLKLKLQVVLSHHVGAKKQAGDLWKSSQCSYLLMRLSSPMHL